MWSKWTVTMATVILLLHSGDRGYLPHNKFITNTAKRKPISCVIIIDSFSYHLRGHVAMGTTIMITTYKLNYKHKSLTLQNHDVP